MGRKYRQVLRPHSKSSTARLMTPEVSLQIPSSSTVLPLNPKPRQSKGFTCEGTAAVRILPCLDPSAAFRTDEAFLQATREQGALLAAYRFPKACQSRAQCGLFLLLLYYYCQLLGTSQKASGLVAARFVAVPGRFQWPSAAPRKSKSKHSRYKSKLPGKHSERCGNV